MSETNEPFNIPDYAHDANDTLAIVPNGDADEVFELSMRLGVQYAEIKRLLARVARLEMANAELLRGLQQYGDYRNWGICEIQEPFCRVFTFGFHNESGWAFGKYAMRRAELAMEGQTLPPHEYFDATTAPEG